MTYQSWVKGISIQSCLFFLPVIILFQFIFCISETWAWGVPSSMQNQVYAYQEIVVRYRTEASLTDIGSTYSRFGLNEVGYSPYSGLRRVRVPSSTSIYTISANLNQNPLVDFAEPNYIRTANFLPNDPLYKYQWHLNNPMIQQSWDISLGSNVIIAVFDTGIAYRNGGGFALAPDLAETNFMPGYDFVNDDSYPDDDNRHGTHIAGIIAQSTNNLYGGSGVAPDCILMPVKVLDESGAGSVADIVDAIYFAVNNGAQIINMSYGFVTSPSASEEEAINYAVSQGVAVICSAGNEATNEAHYPSAYDATICVTSTRYDHSFAEIYSNFGPDVDICAPGGDLDEDVNGDGYPDGIYQQTHNGVDFKAFEFYFAEGTSCSSAFVSGVAALVLARAGRPLSPAELRQILQSTATDLGEPGWDQFYGWGLINPLAAIQAAASYTTASIFTPGIPLQTINPYSTASNAYQVQSQVTSANINPVRVQSQNGIYQTNAGFVTAGQPVTQSIQQFNPVQQVNTQYTYPGYPFNNNFSFFNSYPSGYNTLAASYLFSPYTSSQNLFAAPQQSSARIGYNLASSGGYQTESTIGIPASPYPAQTRSTIPISSLFPFSQINRAFYQGFYPYLF